MGMLYRSFCNLALLKIGNRLGAEGAYPFYRSPETVMKLFGLFSSLRLLALFFMFHVSCCRPLSRLECCIKVDRMIAEADVSGDGRVDYSEFAHLWKTFLLQKHQKPAGRLQQVILWNHSARR